MNSRGTVHASALRPEGEGSERVRERKKGKLQDSADSRVTEIHMLYAECVGMHTFILLCFACVKSNLAGGL